MVNDLLPVTSQANFRSLRSHALHQVETLAIDTECVTGEDGKKNLLEVSVVSTDGLKDVLTTTVRQEGNFVLPEYKKDDFGYSEEALKYSPTLIEVCELLKRIVRGNILVGYNLSSDLKWFPQLKQYAYAVRDVMHRYSSYYGPWNPDWGNDLGRITRYRTTGFNLEPVDSFTEQEQMLELVHMELL